LRRFNDSSQVAESGLVGVLGTFDQTVA
jgi:hypothetical protein